MEPRAIRILFTFWSEVAGPCSFDHISEGQGKKGEGGGQIQIIHPDI